MTIRVIFSIFVTQGLILSEVVVYASNHGYVHPNETDYEPCHSAGFLLFALSVSEI